MQPIAEYHGVDREQFDRDIVPKGEPAVLRGLVADWPIVKAAESGDDALAAALREAAADQPFEAWFGPPEIDTLWPVGPAVSLVIVSVEVEVW